MPTLNKIQKEYKDKGLVVITLSDETREKILDFFQDNPYEFTKVYNKQIEWIDINLGTARPLSFIIDRNGIIKEYYTGARSYEFFKEKVIELL